MTTQTLEACFQRVAECQTHLDERKAQVQGANLLLGEAKAALLEELKKPENRRQLTPAITEAPVLFDGYLIHIGERLHFIDIETAPRTLSMQEVMSWQEAPTNG
ncbi:hypothetical protein [Salinicola tamaricis]|uniref:hypothetical protein n=1 Tax=Salinicola tamaricis TaxID=1771309 RepID=UPI000D0A65B8|nr:hypothetical protein [Salinicola tamaricis]